MMLMPFWQLCELVFPLIPPLTLAFGIAVLILGIYCRFVPLQVIGATLAGLIVWGMVSPSTFGFGPGSLSSQARDVVKLPDEAQVIAVQRGGWAGEGTVVFRLPEDRPWQSWFDAVWKANRIPGLRKRPSEALYEGLLRTVDTGEESRALEYKSTTRLYTFRRSF